MSTMEGIELFQKFQNIDPAIYYRFITAADKKYLNKLRSNNPNVEENIIYTPLWLMK